MSISGYTANTNGDEEAYYHELAQVCLASRTMSEADTAAVSPNQEDEELQLALEISKHDLGMSQDTIQNIASTVLGQNNNSEVQNSSSVNENTGKKRKASIDGNTALNLTNSNSIESRIKGLQNEIADCLKQIEGCSKDEPIKKQGLVRAQRIAEQKIRDLTKEKEMQNKARKN